MNEQNGMTVWFYENSDPQFPPSNPPKTRFTNPYDYDPILHYRDDNELKNSTKAKSLYSDRLNLWNGDKKDALFKQLGMNDYSWNNLEKTQAFMRGWTSNPNLIVTRIVEMCNVSTGYPYYLIDYND